ncbi:MAG: zinc ABC transporter substrate-binding protein [Sulfurovaceae bacterium]|nr:zinc ABC transporter substrate-binding protein [Sulfurovaceae bacterium]MDD5549107.1 zinc ABC transporter substrate-binding protein [Sulfurovaceae bacterium]
MKSKIFIAFMLMSTLLSAKIDIATSIAPQKALVDAIGGKNVNTIAMIPAGASPHSYEPKPSQMIIISKAKVYFTVGIEFEEAWIGRFKSQNKNMMIADSALGIKKIKMVAHHDEDEDEHHHENELDPHVWTNPKNLIIMATNIKNTLIRLDPSNKVVYSKNYIKLVNSLRQTDLQIKTILKNTPNGSKFMIFHPSWGYFAKEYGLIQLPIELEGKEPKAKDLIMLMSKAKKEHIKAIFVAPEFSDKSASQISNTLKIPVVKISNLGYNWHEYMISFAKAIAHYK